MPSTINVIDRTSSEPSIHSEARSRSSSLRSVDLEGVDGSATKPVMPVWDKLEESAHNEAVKPRFRIRSWEEPYDVLYALSLATMIGLALASLHKVASGFIGYIPIAAKAPADSDTALARSAANADKVARPSLRERVNESAKMQYGGFREISAGISSDSHLTGALSDCLNFDRHLFQWASSFTEKTFGPFLYRTIRGSAPRQQHGLIGTTSGSCATNTIRTLDSVYRAFTGDVASIIYA